MIVQQQRMYFCAIKWLPYSPGGIFAPQNDNAMLMIMFLCLWSIAILPGTYLTCHQITVQLPKKVFSPKMITQFPKPYFHAVEQKDTPMYAFSSLYHNSAIYTSVFFMPSNDHIYLKIFFHAVI